MVVRPSRYSDRLLQPRLASYRFGKQRYLSVRVLLYAPKDNASNKPILTNLGPNSNDEHPPQMCPPTWQCAVLRANQGTCPYPQGALEPLICPGGT
jgi:hypothetical protein